MPSEQLQMIVDMMRASQPTGGERSIAEMRAGLEAMTNAAPLPDGARAEPVLAAGVPAAWVASDGASDATILYFHGGGYVMGSIATHRSLVANLSAASGARALVLDYRLAPEDPFPAAIDDALAAYRWLVANGTPPERIVIAGDSAGGGLAVATMVALRDAGDPLPASGVCLSPWTDLACEGESMTTRADCDPMVQRDGLLRMARAYLGDRDPRTPLASPLHADLTGLPPLLVQVGTAEVLLDDATRLAERGRMAGVAVTLDAWEDMIHVWQAFGPLLPEAGRAIERIGAFVRARLG